jgi:hypothetical protein
MTEDCRDKGCAECYQDDSILGLIESYVDNDGRYGYKEYCIECGDNYKFNDDGVCILEWCPKGKIMDLEENVCADYVLCVDPFDIHEDCLHCSKGSNDLVESYEICEVCDPKKNV